MIGRTSFLPQSHPGSRTYVGNYVARSSIGRRDHFHRAIVFFSVAGVVLLIGCALTGIKRFRFAFELSGPILIALSLLLFLISLFYYIMYRKNMSNARRVQFHTTGVGALGALTMTSDDHLGAITFVMETHVTPEPSPEQNEYPPTYTQATIIATTLPVMDPSHNVTSVELPPSYEEATHGIKQHPIVLSSSARPGSTPTRDVEPVSDYMANASHALPPIYDGHLNKLPSDDGANYNSNTVDISTPPTNTNIVDQHPHSSTQPPTVSNTTHVNKTASASCLDQPFTIDESSDQDTVGHIDIEDDDADIIRCAS